MEIDIKKLKFNRLKPEERFFIPFLYGLVEYTSDKYPDSILFKKDNKYLFVYNLKDFSFIIYYNKIWMVLESKFNLNHNEIKKLTSRLVYKYLKLSINTINFTNNFF